jgi:hypothetical protein
MSATVHPFRRPGQCCGLCLHMHATGDERVWHRYECRAQFAANGSQARLPVENGAGTHCAYFRAKPEGTP